MGNFNRRVGVNVIFVVVPVDNGETVLDTAGVGLLVVVVGPDDPNILSAAFVALGIVVGGSGGAN